MNMTEKYVLENGTIKDTTNNISFGDFVDLQIILNGQSRKISSLADENEQLKKQVSRVEALQILKELEEENEQLRREKSKQEEQIEVLKTTIQARDTLIKVCEKKFKELGYIITVDDDGYVIE